MSNPPSSLAAHKLPPELAKVEDINFQVSPPLLMSIQGNPAGAPGLCKQSCEQGLRLHAAC